MRPRWRKTLLDLVDNKLRTVLVVLSIAVGVFAVGMIAGTYVIISNDMSASYAASRPANVQIRTDDFDDDLLATIRHDRAVAEAEGRRVVNMRVRVPGSSKWVTLDIVAIDDFDENNINLHKLLQGKAKPDKREIVLERDALKDLDILVGDELELQLADGSSKRMRVAGVVQDPTTGAGDFLSPPFAYINMDDLSFLREPERYNRIYATVVEGQDDPVHIRQVTAKLKDKIEKAGFNAGRTFSYKTHEHPLASTVNAILGILLALGVLIVFLSSSLIANTLNALLNQHLRHIGVMKLVGARRKQIFSMYIVLILTFGLLALLIAVPLGGQGAYALSRLIADLMSFDLLGYRIVPAAFIIQVLIGLLVPLTAGAGPVVSGARASVLHAISGEASRESRSKTEDGKSRESRWEKFQVRAAAALGRRGVHIPRPVLISLRNTFRRRGRLVLTLFTLTMGGAIFIAVFNVRVSLHEYIGAVGKYFLADVTLDFDQPYRLREVDQYARRVPGVLYTEGWAYASAEALYPDGSVVENLTILAPPAESPLVEPIVISGRWIRPSDQRALAVTEGILALYPGLKPGDPLRLKINGREETWEVVGLFKFIDREGFLAYAPYEYISRINNQANQAYSFRIATDRHDRPYQTSMGETLDEYFRDAGFKVREAKPGLSSLDKASESLDILIVFLLIMALLTATVGSMGLAGTMGMNVLERTREIGIMRAVGAVDKAIMHMVMIEGMVIGSISWILAVIISFPITLLLSTIVSLAIFQTPIDLVFTWMGYVIWLGLVLVLSAVASILPARNAARLTIREVLAYE